ncbi:DASH complex subunit dad4 [Ophidiomyces ophidiicola]|nr:DASH complex subunit dad4 [Ophidiomyces ophidiicola]KAI2138215.1 DASH complex subunit dad4 [Ophidiomyces ophidiicola]
MESPHEQQQNLLLSRIVTNVEKLNEAVMMLNKSLQVWNAYNTMLSPGLTWLQDVNVQNMNVELVAQMFKNYQSNVLFHLEGEHTIPKHFTGNIFDNDSTWC